MTPVSREEFDDLLSRVDDVYKILHSLLHRIIDLEKVNNIPREDHDLHQH